MRIAVVDDNRQEREELVDWIANALEKRCWMGECLEFSNGVDFLNAARKEKFDLVFLDIYMEPMDGVTTARQLRALDERCLLVFTTTSTDHALDGYRVRAMQYLVKPFWREDVELLFDELASRLPQADVFIQVKVGRQMQRLPLGEILWAEHFQHQIHIHTRNMGEILCRMTFGEFSALLRQQEQFLVCGRGVLVNLAHVWDFDGTDFLLDSGARGQVSRTAVEHSRKAFGEYLFQKRRMRS